MKGEFMEKEYGKITEYMAHFCKDTCPVCVKGREKGEGILYQITKLEENICPACRAYKKVYGVPAHEKAPEE
jgi:hypothetical protein